MTKMGCKRTDPKQSIKKTRKPLKIDIKNGPVKKNRKPIRHMSKLEEKRQAEYREVRAIVRSKGFNVSELSGEPATWESGFIIELHHIRGRKGPLLCDPFNWIFLTNAQHVYYQKHPTEENRLYLKSIVFEIRIQQGYTKGEK